MYLLRSSGPLTCAEISQSLRREEGGGRRKGEGEQEQEVILGEGHWGYRNEVQACLGRNPSDLPGSLSSLTFLFPCHLVSPRTRNVLPHPGCPYKRQPDENSIQQPQLEPSRRRTCTNAERSSSEELGVSGGQLDHPEKSILFQRVKWPHRLLLLTFASSIPAMSPHCTVGGD